MKVIYKMPGEDPEVKDIENKLEVLQGLVDGLIEVVPFNEVEDTLIVCNEEGKIRNMEPNIFLGWDYIAGPLLIVGDDYENGDFRDLTDEEVEKILVKI